MEIETIKQVLAERAKDGKITCEECFRVAGELGVPPDGFARILTEMNIKIVNCQLGCFE